MPLSHDADPAAHLSAAVRADDTGAVAAILARHSSLKGRLDEPLPDGPFDGIALTMATSAKNAEMIDVLLSAGANIDAKTGWWAGGFTALDVADPDFAPELIERGATVTTVAAARLGMLDTLRQLLDADPTRVAERGGDGQTPLHVAANVAIAQLLLERGADIDALDVDHESTPAMYHIRDRTAVTKYLMSRGCKTDLLMAAAAGDLDLVRHHLDENPAAIRTTVSERYFPKRNPHAGGTIYTWTLGGNKSAHAIAREFGHEGVFDILIQRTPDILALAIAAEGGDESRVDQLLARSPDISSMLGDEEKLKLVTAAESNNSRAVGLMLRAGWPAGTRGGAKTTALHWASYHGNAEMIRDLLRYGAPVDAVEATFSGAPLDWALHGSLHGWHRRTGDYVSSVKALLNAGARVPANPPGAPEVLALLRN